MQQRLNRIYYLLTLLISFFILIPQHSFAMPAPFSLINVFPGSNFVTAGKPNDLIYLLRNNQTKSVVFALHPLSSRLHIDRTLSTCGAQLPALGLCKLFISFDAPAKLGQMKTGINIVVNNQPMRQDLIFHIVAKKNKNPSISTNADWQSMSGPEGGWITDVVVSPDNSNLLYAGAWGVGVYKSVDGGKNWVVASSGITNASVEHLLLARDALYLLTYRGGIFKSTNQGDYWVPVNNGLPTNDVDAITVSNNVLYAAMYGGIFQSANGGATWTFTGNFPQGVSPHSLLIKGNIMYVGTSQHGIYKSIDSGKTWQQMNAPLTADITTLFDANGVLYAGSPNYLSKGAVFKSTDEGKNWQRADRGLGSCGVTGFALQNNIVYASTFNLDQPNQAGIYKTTNSGADWIPTRKGLTYLYTNQVTATASTLYAATMGSLYQSTNGGDSWSAINNGINANWITAALTLKDNLYVGTANGGIFKYTENEKTWSAASNGIDINNASQIKELIADKAGDLYALTFGAAVYQSQDNAKTWSILNLPNDGTRTVVPASILSNNSTLYLGTTANGVYQSTDRGSTWQQLGSSFSQVVYSIAVVGDNVYEASGYGIFKMPASGRGDWTRVSEGLPFVPINKLVGTADGLLYAAASQGLFFTATAGGQWQLMKGMPKDANVASLLVNGTTVIAGTTEYGIYLSRDSGRTGTAINKGLNLTTYNPVDTLTQNTKFTFAGTVQGIYRTSALQ